MKKEMISLVLITALGYLVLENFGKLDFKLDTPPKIDTIRYSPPPHFQPLRIVYLQDVTGSIKINGVEVVTPDIFRPYFNVTDRAIEIYFGIITSQSLQKFVVLTLPPVTYIKPVQPDLRTLSASDQIKAKEQFVKACKKYEADSISFYIGRSLRIRSFCDSVDTILVQFKNQLASSTDLTTSVNIADRVFNFSVVDSARNIMLVNSDGYDTHGKTVTKLANRVEVYLIGATVGRATSMDSIITKRFAFSEQAISFTLK